MASKFICRTNKFGYCWYGEKCKNKHVNELCEKRNCEIFNCEKRHPKICKYKRDYGYCKFKEYCKFSHEKPEDIMKFIEKFEIIEKQMKVLESRNSSEKTIDSISDIFEKKLKNLESKVDHQRKDLDTKNSQILGLEMKLDELEKKYKSDKLAKDKKIKELENIVKNKGKRDQESFKCSDCEFVSKSKNGLKTHKAKMHTKTKESEYPAECEFCQAKLPSEKEMKQHLRLHTYKKSTFKCEDCDYWCENFLTMEVHVGKHHSEKIECGLCNYEAKDVEALDLHLTTCQIYICEDCYCRTKHLHNIKEHLNEKHSSDSDYFQIIHAKINLKDPETIDQDFHAKIDIC